MMNWLQVVEQYFILFNLLFNLLLQSDSALLFFC